MTSCHHVKSWTYNAEQSFLLSMALEHFQVKGLPPISNSEAEIWNKGPWASRLGCEKGMETHFPLKPARVHPTVPCIHIKDLYTYMTLCCHMLLVCGSSSSPGNLTASPLFPVCLALSRLFYSAAFSLTLSAPSSLPFPWYLSLWNQII